MIIFQKQQNRQLKVIRRAFACPDQQSKNQTNQSKMKLILVSFIRVLRTWQSYRPPSNVSDVGEIIGEFLMVTDFKCWWQNFLLCCWFSQCIKSVIRILNRSPTTQTCHQHIWLPTSVTNINVTWMSHSLHSRNVKIFMRIVHIFFAESRPFSVAKSFVVVITYCYTLVPPNEF